MWCIFFNLYHKRIGVLKIVLWGCQPNFNSGFSWFSSLLLQHTASWTMYAFTHDRWRLVHIIWCWYRYCIQSYHTVSVMRSLTHSDPLWEPYNVIFSLLNTCCWQCTMCCGDYAIVIWLSIYSTDITEQQGRVESIYEILIFCGIFGDTVTNWLVCRGSMLYSWLGLIVLNNSWLPFIITYN